MCAFVFIARNNLPSYMFAYKISRGRRQVSIKGQGEKERKLKSANDYLISIP